MCLDLFSCRPQFFYHSVQATLVDCAYTLGRNFEGYPFILFGEVKTLGLQIGQKPALGLDV